MVRGNIEVGPGTYRAAGDRIDGMGFAQARKPAKSCFKGEAMEDRPPLPRKGVGKAHTWVENFLVLWFLGLGDLVSWF